MMQATNDFTMLYERHHRSLWAFCYRLCDNHAADADDLASETWLRAWRAGITPDEPLSYLRKIAHNLARDRWRSRRWQIESELMSLTAEEENRLEKIAPRAESGADASFLSPTSYLLSPLDEGWDSVLAVWSQLTEEQAQAVALWADGWPADEAGVVSGRSAGAHKALRHRGVARLKQALGVAA